MAANSWQAGREPVATRSSRLVQLPAVVYAYFDVDGTCLYIGQTTNLRSREYEHERNSAWFAEVDERRILADCEVRSEAIMAEREFIKQYRPKHNRVHNRSAA